MIKGRNISLFHLSTNKTVLRFFFAKTSVYFPKIYLFAYVSATEKLEVRNDLDVVSCFSSIPTSVCNFDL